MNGMSLAWLLIGGSLCSVMALLVLLWLLWLERRSQRCELTVLRTARRPRAGDRAAGEGQGRADIGVARGKPMSPSCVGKSSCCETEICC